MRRLILTLALLAIHSPHSQLMAQGDTVRVRVQNARLRDAPSFQGKILATLNQGSPLLVLGQDGDWVRVRYLQTTGFVHLSMLPGIASAEATAATPPTSPPAVAPPTPSPVAETRPNTQPETVPQQRREGKDPGTATILSIVIVGAGQMYAGDINRGLLMLGGAYGAIIAGAILSTGPGCDAFDCHGGNYVPLGIGALAAAGIWIWGIVDAAPTTRRMNQARGLATLPGGPLFVELTRRETRIGVRIGF